MSERSAVCECQGDSQSQLVLLQLTNQRQVRGKQRVLSICTNCTRLRKSENRTRELFMRQF